MSITPFKIKTFEKLMKITIDNILNRKWIVNMSIHSNDKYNRVKWIIQSVNCTMLFVAFALQTIFVDVVSF